MTAARDRADRTGSTPVQIGSTKLTTDSNNNLSVLDTSDAPKKLIASEIEIGDSSNKVIIKKGSDNKVQFQTQASGGSATDSNAGGGVTVVANTTALNALTGNAVGDLAFVTANNKLYIRQSGGWYTVATGSNATPVISSAGDASYTLATDGTAVVVTVTATDDEGETITYNYNVSSGSLTNGGGATATVTQGTGSNVNQFTITPTTTQAYAGDFSLTFTAQDTNGNTATSSASAFTLQWFQQMFVPSGTTLLLGMSFDSSGIGKSGSYNTPTTLGSGIETFYTSGGYNSTMNGHAGYPSAVRANNGYQITELNNVNSSKGKTFIIWYKGTQTGNAGHYSIGVPIISNYSNTWAGMGINNGKISTHSGSATTRTEGTTNVVDGNWHMLTWVHSDGTHSRLNNQEVGMWVDGVYDTKHTISSAGTSYFKVNKLFVSYSGENVWRPPTRVDAFQIFDSELTDAQILSIYQGS
jgi:hypothetical protein